MLAFWKRPVVLSQTSSSRPEPLPTQGVAALRDALPRLVAELERARRYSRPFTVAVVSAELPDGRVAHPHPGEGVQGNGSSRLFSPLLASILRETLRDCDLVMYSAIEGRCLVGMPELGAEEARQAVARLHDLCATRLTLPLRSGVGVFPEDGWTLEDLLQHAESDWLGDQSPISQAEGKAS